MCEKEAWYEYGIAYQGWVDVYVCIGRGLQITFGDIFMAMHSSTNYGRLDLFACTFNTAK